MGCTGCKDQEDMVAKDCPVCGRRFVGSSEVCGYCNAAEKTVEDAKEEKE